MAEIILDDTGKSKSSVVERAYEQLGITAVELTPEEISNGLRLLNDMLAEWLADGIDLGYDFPTYGEGTAAELSGLPDSAVSVVAGMLAQRLAGPNGATLDEEAKAALNRSYQSLRTRYASIVSMEMPGSPFQGMGWKRRRRLYRAG